MNMLVGRERELGRIEALIARARSGDGVVATVEGPAGIGKTALLKAAQRECERQRMTVLRATGAPLEQEFAFGVARQLFAFVVREPEGLLEGAAGLASVPLGMNGAGVEGGGGWGDPAAAAMHGLHWLSARLADRGPLVLMLDDAHWADEMSLRFLLYLVRRLSELPVLVLVAARPDRDSARHRELLDQLGEYPGLEVFRPAPLSAGEVAQVISAAGMHEADPAFVAACRDVSAGNPFLLRELLAALRADGASGRGEDAPRVLTIAPERVVRWVSTRLLALGDDAERVASALAVLGAGATLSEATALEALEPSAAAAATDALIAADILDDRQPFGFVHPLVEAAVYERLAPARRADAHARAARVLVDRRASSARVAAHLLLTAPGDDAWVVETLRIAAREARASGAARSAAGYLERAALEAVSDATRAELLLELGDARLQAGQAGAADSIRAAVELCADRRTRAETYLALGRALFATGEFEPARSAFRCGLAELGDDDEDLFLELRAWYVTDARHELPLPDTAASRLQALIAGDEPGTTPVERRLLAQAAYHSARSGERTFGQVARIARRALADGELLRDSGADIGPYGAACHALLAAGEPDAAVAELTHAVELSQRRGWWVAFAWFSHLRGVAQYTRGNLIEASADLESANAAYVEAGAEPLPDTRAILALCRVERDDLAGAIEVLGLDRRPPPSSSCAYDYAVGRVRGAQGRLQDGLDALIDCKRWVEDMAGPNPAANVPWRADAALLAAQLGDRERASALIAENVRLARAYGAPGALGLAVRASGVIDGGSHGLEQLAEAVWLLEMSGMRMQLARALIEHGAALRRAGRRRDARGQLRTGLDLAARCGALVLARRARDELVAAGARPRRERMWGAEALTASELRVARMAAAGMSNPQIAQALFISRKTVTVHLTRIYQKLDITSRTELQRSLQDDHAAESLPTELS